jgi:hypothetical protein
LRSSVQGVSAQYIRRMSTRIFKCFCIDPGRLLPRVHNDSQQIVAIKHIGMCCYCLYPPLVNPSVLGVFLLHRS